MQRSADQALRKVNHILCTFPRVTGDLTASCSTGGHFQVEAGSVQLLTAVCVRFRKLLPRHVWLRACALFVNLLVPAAPLVGEPGTPPGRPCTISAALFKSRSTHAGYAAAPLPHCAAECPKCAVVPHVATVLRQQISAVIDTVCPPLLSLSAATHAWISHSGSRSFRKTLQAARAMQTADAAPPPEVPLEEPHKLVERAASLFGFGALALGQCIRDAPRLFRHLHSVSPGVASDRRSLAVRLPPPRLLRCPIPRF